MEFASVNLPNSTKQKSRRVRFIFWSTGALVFAAVLYLRLILPSLDGFHSRRLANEASAASSLRAMIILENEYMAAHAYVGFACELLAPEAYRPAEISMIFT